MEIPSTLESEPSSEIALTLKQAPQRSQEGARAVFQSIVARLAIIAVNAGTGIVTARALAPDGRGELSAIILWPVLLANAMTLGLPSALTYNTRRAKHLQSDLIGTALFNGLLVNVLSAAVAAIFLPRILHLYSPDVILYARLFLLSAPFGIFLQIARAAFESNGDFGVSTKSQWLVPSLTLLGLLVLLALHKLTPYTAAYAYVLNSLPVITWITIKLWREFRPSIKRLRSVTRILLSYGIRSYGIDLCGTLALYVDQALVVGLLRADAMGIYVVALSLSRFLNVCQTSVVMVLFPKTVGLTLKAIVDLTGRAARVSTILTSVLGVAVFLFGPFVLRIMYGPQYVAASAVLRVLVVEVILAGLTMVLAQAAMALGRPGIVTILQSIGLALTVPLMMFFIPRWGLLGAGWALLISTSCRLVFIYLSFPLFLGCRCPRLTISSSDLRLILEQAVRIVPGVGRFAPAPTTLSREEAA
jgi:O-antigen/teichoic acid export membrane protein